MGRAIERAQAGIRAWQIGMTRVGRSARMRVGDSTMARDEIEIIGFHSLAEDRTLDGRDARPRSRHADSTGSEVCVFEPDQWKRPSEVRCNRLIWVNEHPGHGRRLDFTL
jgi:hypothetical protein